MATRGRCHRKRRQEVSRARRKFLVAAPTFVALRCRGRTWSYTRSSFRYRKCHSDPESNVVRVATTIRLHHVADFRPNADPTTPPDSASSQVARDDGHVGLVAGHQRLASCDGRLRESASCRSRTAQMREFQSRHALLDSDPAGDQPFTAAARRPRRIGPKESKTAEGPPNA